MGGNINPVNITGSAFGYPQGSSTLNAGTGITFAVQAWSSEAINATFRIAQNAPAGSHSVTVTTSAGASNSDKTFYVQVPTKLLTPTLVTHTFANQHATHCDGSDIQPNPSANRWGTEMCFLYYTLQDQQTPTPGTIDGSGLTASEAFQWKSGDTNLPQAWTGVPSNALGQIGDEQSIFSTTGPIPPTYAQKILQTITVTNNQQAWTVRFNCNQWSGSNVNVADVTSNPSSCTP